MADESYESDHKLKAPKKPLVGSAILRKTNENL